MDGVVLLECAIRGGNLGNFETLVEKSKQAKECSRPHADIVPDAAEVIRLLVPDAADVVRLLAAAITRGDPDLVKDVVEFLGDLAKELGYSEGASLLLAHAVQSGNIKIVKRIVKCLGEMEIVKEIDGASLFQLAVGTGKMGLMKHMQFLLGDKAVMAAYEERGPSLFESAVSTGNLELVREVAGNLGEQGLDAAIRVKGYICIALAIRRGDLNFLNYVIDTTGPSMPSETNLSGVSDLQETLRAGDMGLVKCLADIVDRKFPRHGRGKSPFVFTSLDGYSFLVEHTLHALTRETSESIDVDQAYFLVGSAIRSGHLDLVNYVIGAVRIQVTGEHRMLLLLKSAMKSSEVALVKAIVAFLPHEGMASLPNRGALSLVECAATVRSQEVDPAVVVHGGRPRSMPCRRDVSFVEQVIDILGDEVVRDQAQNDANAFFRFGLRSADRALFEKVVFILGIEKIKDEADEANAREHLLCAARWGNVGLVTRVVQILETTVLDAVQGPELVLSNILKEDDYWKDLLYEVTWRARGGAGLLKELFLTASREPQGEKETDMASRLVVDRWDSEVNSSSALCAAVSLGNVELVQEMLEILDKILDPWKVVEYCTPLLCWKKDKLSESCLLPNSLLESERAFKERHERFLRTQSILLHFGAVPKPDKIRDWLQPHQDSEQWRKFFLGSVSTAPNPFVPGINLLVALDEARRLTPEGNKQGFHDLRQNVSRLLLVTLEQLQKTVDSEDVMNKCSSLFETNTMENPSMGFTGPLGIALRHRRTMEKVCPRSLVLHFMDCKFMNAHSSNKTPISNGWFGILLEKKPEDYCQVPMWRMVFDLEIYLLFVIWFSYCVLLREDGEWKIVQPVFIMYILGAVVTEAIELLKDMPAYFRDRWNVLDLLAIVSMTGGWIAHLTDPRSSWGKGLYAISTPLIFSRVLFFAQLHPSQGPMIQVVFAMSGKLLQFGMVMAVVMLGFAVSFFALLRESWRDYTYADACLDLFQAMLGEVGLFSDLEDLKYGDFATTLLGVYLVVMSILLLNLLIAVLSTAHAQVHENIVDEYKVSKARLIQHYVWTVKHGSLPAPLNVVQLLVSLPFWLAGHVLRGEGSTWLRQASDSAASFLFGLFFTPVGVVLEIFRVTTSLVEEFFEDREKMFLADLKELMQMLGFILLLLPVVTLLWVIWLFIGLVRSRNENSSSNASYSGSRDHKLTSSTLGDWLKESRNQSVSELRGHLEDTMSDPVVRGDERAESTRVEHLKLLRDHLDKMIERVDTKVEHLDKRIESVSTMVEKLERDLGSKNGSDNR